MLQFSCRFAFLSTFCCSNQTPNQRTVCNFSIWTVADVYRKRVQWQRNHDAVVKFDTYWNSHRHRVVLPEIVARRKTAKYTDMSSQFMYHPIVVETQGPINESACDLPREVGIDALPSALVTTTRVLFSFSVFQLSRSSLILCCCMTVFVLTTSRPDWCSFQINFLI